MAKINRNVLTVREDQAPKIGASLSQSEPRKISMVGIKPHIPDLNVKPCSDSNEEEKGEIGKAFQNLAGLKTHDACYIIARLPCFEYWKLQFLNKKFLQLLKSCEIFRVRQERGLVKPYVILHSGAVSNWEMFDKDFKTFRRLPKIPFSDYCFFYSGKETVSRVVHSCCPSPDVEEQHWEEIRHWCVGAELPQFIHNCCVMFA
ncbi:unnamed protein product [Brassica napus]|uniref:(rape) hypothetical protein n=1 Tax=Brassica napus TaxID=3708 RepID=A0A817B3X8_BRANA|nr:unnamed protein product [Brassica napus]CAF2280130.1 unnamed protein product [Brassica napus]